MDAHLRDDRYCSMHGIDLVPPDRTLLSRRYCPRCPPGSALGFPEWMINDRRSAARLNESNDRLDDAVFRLADCWKDALESGKHVPVRRLLPELARALDRLIDEEGEAP